MRLHPHQIVVTMRHPLGPLGPERMAHLVAATHRVLLDAQAHRVMLCELTIAADPERVRVICAVPVVSGDFAEDARSVEDLVRSLWDGPSEEG